MKKVFLIVFILFGGIVFFSCKKTSTPAPGPPTVWYKDFNVVRETEAYFHFGFKDPDGDIGLQNKDTTGAFAFGSPYYYDFHMRIFKYDTVAQAWVPGVIVYQGDSFGIWKYRIPYVENKAKDKSLTGEIYVEMTGYRPVTTLKRFRYEFYIFDRAHNKSNVVTTPEFNYP
ncbi:MAG TPA: hypothetical protein VNY73_05270 [Bacteroidia bacterium]|nr:hypothetical protein [Bacteroidia bacterium]